MSADVGRFPGEVLAAEYRAARERPSRLWGLTYDTVVHEHDLVVGEGEVQLELATEPFECLRLLGSRRTVEELRAAPFVGDLDRYLPGIVHMDVPSSSLME